jgi:hypothetical protein
MPRRELAGTPSPQRARMWRMMRTMPDGFAVRDLIAVAEVRRKAAEKFLLPLTRAGYVRAEKAGCARRYVLIRDNGPIAPRVGRSGQVVDVNAEIVKDRARHARLLTEIRGIEARLTRLGAYVEKFTSLLPAGESL